jgi:hypothetical protein
MTPDSATADGDCEVMAAVDGSENRLVIAELCRDEAWLSAPLGDAVTVEDNR